MAPLNFSDNIALYSLVGTWLGTLCTLLGLLAVVAQLRTLLKDFALDRKERIKNAAGDYAVCLPNLRHSDAGVLEARAPSLSTWINEAYSDGREIAVCSYERKIAAGQSSWSQLFSRLQIAPDELKRLSSPSASRTRNPMQADILVDGTKISYGMAGDEFAALLILSGFSPSDFTFEGTSSKTGHLGHMFLGTRDPFSQIAQLDSSRFSCSLREVQDSDAPGRFTHKVDVRHCVDLALGIFRFDCKGRSLVFVPDIPLGVEYGLFEGPSTFSNPSPERLVAVRRNLTHLTRGSKGDILHDISSTTVFNFNEEFFTNSLWKYPFPSPLRHHSVNDALSFAIALRVLRPWGILPVLPRSIVDVLVHVLDNEYLEAREGGSRMLIQKFRKRSKEAFHVPGWTHASMSSALDTLADIHEHGFSGLSGKCALYFDAMAFVFRYHNIDLGSVEIGLAAFCGSNILYAKLRQQIRSDTLRQRQISWLQDCQAAIRERLGALGTTQAEPWACDILATYLRAWLNGSKHLEEDFRGNFRRRVFLG